MADDTPDLISNISITGADTAVNTLQDLGDKGSAALDKLSSSAQKSADNIATASDQITKSLSSVSQAVPDTSAADHLAAIEASARSLGSAVRSGISDISSFTLKLGAVGAAAVTSIVGLAKFADSITQATRPPIDTTEELTRQLDQLNKQAARNVSGQVQYDNSLRNLNNDLALGKVNYVTYADSVKALNLQYDDQRKAHLAMQEAMRETLKENQELQIQATQTEAYNHLVFLFGTSLAGSVKQFGDQAFNLQKELRDAFGPVISGLLDKLVALINNNSAAITNMINSAAKSLDDFAKTAGPSIQDVGKLLVDMGRAAISAVTDIIVPAFKALVSVLDTVASVINSVFGTKFSGSALLIAGIILGLTGGFTALFAVINIGIAVFGVLATLLGGPVAIVVVAITALLVALYVAVDWKALGNSIQNTFNTLKTAGSDAVQSVLGFFTSFPANLAIVWAAIIAGATDLWNQLVAGFNSLVQGAIDVGNQIGLAFQNAWDKITSGATNMWNTVKGYFNDLIDRAKNFLGLQAQAQQSSQDSGGSAAGFAEGGHIRGAGSWTSDSIPAWLSNNEFVMRAKSVAKYGVGFMEAINAGALDLNGIIQGFANGGLVGAMPVPRFAVGGPVSKAQRVLNLTIGGETFQGLQMPEAVADRMTKFAVTKQVSSAGRKPAWTGR